MKIATWNINECVGITCDLNAQKTVDSFDEKRINEVVETINKYNFDVICFQEYPIYIDEEHSLTQEIIDKTPLKHYESLDTYDTYLFHGGRGGVAVFSKYPIEETFKTIFVNPNLVKLSPTGQTYYTLDKGIIKIMVKIEGVEYTIITGHAIAFAPFDKSEFDYTESYDPLVELINENADKNLIVIGDFNTEKLFELIPSIKNEVVDVINGPTTTEWYLDVGEVQVDYIMINDRMKAGEIDKIRNFSDHYIMGAEISIK